MKQIPKLYLSNFLTGLVFWYGIEKLFMRQIGIDAVGIGASVAALTIFMVIFDIPLGVLADRWSRKGVLVVSSLALAAASWLCGASHNLTLYIIGNLFYGLYVVASSGTYQAIIYDSLHEESRANDYSRVNGSIFAFFLVGTAVGNIASGFLAHHYGFRSTYFLTIITCVLNGLVILSLREPAFHKATHKERMIVQLNRAITLISHVKLLRVLVVIITTLSAVELFKLEFGQLYMLRYITAPQAIGILWAVYSLAMALGSLIAHRLHSRLNPLIICATLPLLIMSFVDNRFSLVLFMVQAVAAAALINQIDTRIQDHAPSHVRASILSTVSTLGRLVSVPASFLLGWLFREYNALVALRWLAVLAALILAYWLWSNRGSTQLDEPIIA